MSKGDSIWLGTPVKSVSEDFLSPYTSRIGGTAVLFREVSDSRVFKCVKCRSSRSISLLAQIYAPLEVYDRVLYVFVCSACSREECSFCFAIRSQNLNLSYVTAPQNAERGDSEDKGALFEENADWGDGSDGEWDDNDHHHKNNNGNNKDDVTENSVSESTAANAMGVGKGRDIGATGTTDVPSVLAPHGSKPPIEGTCYPRYGLEIFLEPLKLKTKAVAVKEQLHEAQQKYGEDVVEMAIVEDDDEPLHEKRLRKYVERISRVPSQCIRWGPNQEPLRSSVTPIVVPDCPHCGKERRYELQLTSPIIYYLTKSRDEKNHPLHFGNVHVFTCSGNCNVEAYTSEYCVVEEEI
ncbi:pre-rRNA-processing protein TSR4 [Trypanosoma grayi]|uniref:pre-rRNA-processing protein TSR4 n=1 Tax=Trypanosoma grayi TaxID=71804 RepID=UPI0004F44FE6|nr:pre-rRNA-processing protein TSR4 [Trypanosoma grayi]KEG11684.1 pre-rRNA-processing protein TSR4 [Trypanosoma grayi]